VATGESTILMQIDSRFLWACFAAFAIVILVGGYAIATRSSRLQPVVYHDLHWGGPSHRKLGPFHGPGIHEFTATVHPTPTAMPTVDGSAT
jgi:hypothetical protein